MKFRTARSAASLAIAAVTLVVVAACVPEAPPASTTTTSTTEATTSTTEATTTTTEATTTTTEATTTTSTTVAPLVAAATFSSTTGLAQVGSTVTVTGTGFDPALLTPAGTPANQAVAGVYVAIGIGEGPVPTAYTSAKYIRPTGPAVETASGARLNADGSFSATIATPALFAGQGQAVNCYVDACKVFVWSAHLGTVASWTFSSPATFAAPTTKQVVLSKSTGLNRAGETIQVVGAGFEASAPGIYVGQVPYGLDTAPAGWNLDAGSWGHTQFLNTGAIAGGNFRTTINTALVIGSGEVDCGTTACNIVTVKAHGTPDPTARQTSFTPIAFAAAPAI